MAVGYNFEEKVPFVKLKLIFFVILLTPKLAKCVGFVEPRTCATLFSGDEANSTFVLQDWDQVANFHRDYRSLIGGWRQTESLKIEAGCTLSVCDGAFFTGNCVSLTQQYYAGNPLIMAFKSAQCSCKKKCRCQNMVTPMSHQYGGRIYLREGCNACNSEYIPLRRGSSYISIPEDYQFLIRDFTVAEQCTFKLYGGNGFYKTINKTYIEKEDLNFTVKSAFASCNPVVKSSEPQLIEAPSTARELKERVQYNDTLSRHPGLLAAMKSEEKNRSLNNAYILCIYCTPYTLGITGCPSATSDKIGVCHIPVRLNDLRISNAQLRMIYMDGSLDSEHLAIQVASLANYISNHEELQHIIPNAVIVNHMFLYSASSDYFKRMLAALRSLGDHVIDDGYSNIIFFAQDLSSPSSRRNPDKFHVEYEKAIKDCGTLPLPAFITSYGQVKSPAVKVNGYNEMYNGIFWPKNLQENLMIIAEKHDDPLGRAIFNAAFPEERITEYGLRTTINVLKWGDPKVEAVHQCLINSTLSPVSKSMSSSTVSKPTSTTSETKAPSITLQQLQTLLLEQRDLNSNRTRELEKKLNQTNFENEKLAAQTENKLQLLQQKFTDKIKNEHEALQANFSEIMENKQQVIVANLTSHIDKELHVLQTNFTGQIQELKNQFMEDRKKREEEHAQIKKDLWKTIKTNLDILLE